MAETTPIGSKLPYQDIRGEKESERERRRKEEGKSRNETRVKPAADDAIFPAGLLAI